MELLINCVLKRWQGIPVLTKGHCAYISWTINLKWERSSSKQRQLEASYRLIYCSRLCKTQIQTNIPEGNADPEGFFPSRAIFISNPFLDPAVGFQYCWPMHTAILPERSGRAWGHSKVIEKDKSSAQQGETAPLLLEDSPMKTHRTQVCLHLFSISLWSFRVSWPDSTGWSAGSRGKRVIHCTCGSPLSVRSSSCAGSSHGRGIPKADATRLGSEKLSERIAPLQRSLHRLTASAPTVRVTDPKPQHSASQHLYVCMAASCCSFRTHRFSVAAGSEAVPVTWLQPIIPVSSPLSCSCPTQAGRQPSVRGKPPQVAMGLC